MADFTIDLAKLGEKESGMTMPEVEMEAEGIGSEDEGPEDFTLNMEKWMRGNEKWRREGGEDVEEKDKDNDDGRDGQQADVREWSGRAEEHECDKDAEEDAEEDVEEDAEDDDEESQHEDSQAVGMKRIHKDHTDESEFEPLSTSTPAPCVNQKRTAPLDVGSANHGNLQPPPLSRVNTETLQNKAADEVFDQISALQAEVERLRLGDQNNRYINEMLKRAHVSDQEENGRLKTELQSVKDMVMELQEQKGAIESALAREKKFREDAGSKVGSLRAKFEPMVQELAVARSTADAEKKAADSKIATLQSKLITSQMETIKEQKDSKALQEAKQDEIDKLRSEIREVKRESSGYRQAIDASQREISKERSNFEALKATNEGEIRELKAKLDRCQHDILVHEQTLQEREDDHTFEITKLITKVEAAKDLESNLAVQKMDLDHAHEQLQETRRIVETVKQENDRFTKENERQRKENAEITGLLTRKDTELQAAESSIEKLQAELAGHQGEQQTGTTDAEAHGPAFKDLKQQHETGMQELKSAHEKELKSLKSTILRVSDGMRKREHRFEKSHREELAALHQKIASLEKCAAASKRPVPDPAVSADVPELRGSVHTFSSRLAATTAALQGTRLALTESQDALAELRAQTAEIRASKAAGTKELEAQFAVEIEKREKEWRRRMEVMFRDREKMSKALLWAWGREEVGDKGKEAEGGKQGYRYQFVKR